MSQTISVLATSIAPLITSFAQSRAVNSQASYESSILQENARISDLQAANAIHRGEIEATRAKLQARRNIGAARAAGAAQGQDLKTDNQLQIQQDYAAFGAEDVFDYRNNAWNEAFGYRTQAQNYRNKATLTRSAASNVSRNTVLTGGLQFAQSLAYGIYSMK